MRRMFLCAASACLVAATALVVSAQQQKKTVAAEGNMTVDEALVAFRSDMQSTRADIIAKNVTLSADQASKFWPVFNEYQKEQNAIMDAQMKGIQNYADAYQNVKDADALAMLNAHLTRDAEMVALRQKYVAEFQKVLPPRLAVRVLEIDRRLSLLAQLELASKIPVIH